MDGRPTREMLSSLIRWNGKRVLVCSAFPRKKESNFEAIIEDIHLLDSLGVDLHFLCNSVDIPFLENTLQERGVKYHEVVEEKDLFTLVEVLKASKFFFLCNTDGIFNKGKLVSEMTDMEAQELLEEENVVNGLMRTCLEYAVGFCDIGISRVHFTNICRREAFLEEFLTGKGSGTMIYRAGSSYKKVRSATRSDIPEVTRILKSLLNGCVFESFIAENIDKFVVFAIDGYPYGALMLNPEVNGKMKMSYLGYSSELAVSEVLTPLIKYAVNKSMKLRKKQLYLCAEQAPPLVGILPDFLNFGFKKERMFDLNQGSKEVWVKEL